MIRLFRDEEFDVATLVFNRFHSVMTQKRDRNAADPGGDADRQ